MLNTFNGAKRYKKEWNQIKIYETRIECYLRKNGIQKEVWKF